jgi:hypothetical protein
MFELIIIFLTVSSDKVTGPVIIQKTGPAFVTCYASKSLAFHDLTAVGVENWPHIYFDSSEAKNTNYPLLRRAGRRVLRVWPFQPLPEGFPFPPR